MEMYGVKYSSNDEEYSEKAMEKWRISEKNNVQWKPIGIEKKVQTGSENKEQWKKRTGFGQEPYRRE